MNCKTTTKFFCINGQIRSRKKNLISVDDRGLLLGDGLFETLRFEKSKCAHFNQHWERFSKGCRFLVLSPPFKKEKVLKKISDLLKVNQLTSKPAAVRFTLTRGAGSTRGLSLPKKNQPNFLIHCSPILPEKTEPMAMQKSDIIINEFSLLRKFKSLNYAEQIIARIKAQKNGYDDALLFNSQGKLVSSTSANVFLVFNKTIITPTLSSGALPGVTRSRVLRTAKALGHTIEEAELSRTDCEKAKTAFLTNTILQMRIISRIGEHTLTEKLPFEKEDLM